MSEPCKKPSVMYVRGTVAVPLAAPTGTVAVPVDKLKGHARIPAGILADKRLSACDVRVYAVISLAERGGLATIGERLLAKCAHTSRTQVRRSLEVLRGYGHLGGEGHRSGTRRAQYRLTDPIFAGHAAAPVAEVSVPQMKACGKCSRPVRATDKTGLCRGCATERRLLEQLAAARTELGAGATAEELAAHLKNRKLAARIRRILQLERVA